MKVAIFIGNKGTSGERFAEALNTHTINEYSILRYSDVVVLIRDGRVSICDRNGMPLVDDYDIVYLRGITFEPLRHAMAAYLKSKDIAVVNTEAHRYQTMTKLEQYVVLALDGVPVPDGVFFGSSDNYILAPNLLGVNLPIVAKSIVGSNGNDNCLIATVAELEELTIDMPIFQPFIANKFDYRVIVAGEGVALSYRRIRDVKKDTYKNNIGQGGRREMVEINDDLKLMAVKAAKAVGREFAGLDILPNIDETEHVVLEVNFNFGTPVFDDASLEAEYYRKLDQYFQSLV